jgi:hypothetical protein
MGSGRSLCGELFFHGCFAEEFNTKRTALWIFDDICGLELWCVEVISLGLKLIGCGCRLKSLKTKN